MERIAFNTAYLTGLLNARFMTMSPDAIVAHGRMPTDPLTRVALGSFVSSLGLWMGLGRADAA